MSLTRTDLSKMGVPEEFHSQIIAKHRDTVDEIKLERDQYKAQAEQVPGLTAERDQWKQKAEDGTATARIAELENQVKGYEAEKLNGKKRTALTELLEEIGVDKAVIPLVLDGANLDEMELDGDGLKDHDGLAQSYKRKYSGFIQTVSDVSKNPPTPPANIGGKMTKDQIMAIKDRKERQTAIAQNLDLFENKKGE